MRLALVTRRFDPVGGGTERDLTITARILAQAGHQVTIYAAETRTPSLDWTVRRVPTPPLGRALRLLWFARAAGATALRDGAELVLSFARIVEADLLRSGGGAHASYLRAARRWRSAPGAAAMRLAPYHRVQMAVEAAGFRNPRLRRAIGVSNLVRDDLAATFGLAAGRAVTIYNGVELDRFRPEADPAARAEIRRLNSWPDDACAVLFVGNGFARKGLRYLIEAWPTANRAARLFVIGADRKLRAYRNLTRRRGLEERIAFLGPRGDVAALMRAADALALPSLFEPFGNVALEAMAAGAPALVSAYCGAAEAMPPALRSFVVANPLDKSELTAKLEALLDAAPRLRAAARAAAEAYTWERHGRELLALIDAAAASRR